MDGQTVLKRTVPDFLWIYKHKAIYLDGEQVHLNREEWDEEVVRLLEKRGCSVPRISYHAPMSKEKLEEVLYLIAEFVNGGGK